MTHRSNPVKGGRVVHGPGCPTPDLAAVRIMLGNRGQHRVVCKGCSPAFVADAPKVEPVPLAPSRYRCPEHPEESVRRTPKGFAVGCQICERERRWKRRPARPETPELEMSYPTLPDASDAGTDRRNVR